MERRTGYKARQWRKHQGRIGRTRAVRPLYFNINELINAFWPSITKKPRRYKGPFWVKLK